MKLKLLSLLLLITTISKAQKTFSTAFQGNSPLPLITIEDELFVGLFGDNEERLAGVYKLPFDNSSAIDAVYEIPNGFGPLYIVYDSNTNSLFMVRVGIGLIKLDLNEMLPANEEVIIDNNSLNIAENNGLIYNENFVYFNVGNDAIYRISTSEDSDPELFYIVPDADIFVITQIVNNELYYFKYNDTIGADLIKIDVSNPISETIVSTLDEFELFVQSSNVVNNTLFVGVETINSSSPSIIKFDLAQTIPITREPIELIESINAVLGITSYEDDLYFTDGFSQNIYRLEDGALNVLEVENREFSVFPNPTSDRLFIQVQHSDRIEYQLIDILGKLIRQGVYSTEGIDFSRLDTGVYFVKLTDANGNIITQKVVKK